MLLEFGMVEIALIKVKKCRDFIALGYILQLEGQRMSHCPFTNKEYEVETHKIDLCSL